ncbi:serine hydrolase [Nostoc sp. FACHB-973]|nr:serine hydrolase [Nostoc sp. FACHB-973]
MRQYYINFISTSLLTINFTFSQVSLADVKPELQPLNQMLTQTESISPKAALERLFTSQKIQNEWFTPDFLAQVPIEKLRQIIDELKNQLGTYESVQNNLQDYLVIFSQGSVPTKIVLNSKGQISGLFFEQPQIKFMSLEEATNKFQELPGKVSFLVQEGKTIQAALNTKMPLAVGSAFKLAVLKALKSEIASGKRTWKDVVQLQPNWKSLPSGVLQTWPDGTYLTLQTLAAFMISISDNTATDILINLIGRESIELLSLRNRPFLTTREFFLLKSSQNENFLQRYRTSNEAERRAILKELSKKPLPDASEFGGGNPVALDIEWFFTAEELCGLIEQVADLPLLTINPGVAKAQDWQRIAFKGGSETGVFNMTTWLQGKNGKNYCVVATWNNSDAAVEESKFMALYSGVLAKLADNK